MGGVLQKFYRGPGEALNAEPRPGVVILTPQTENKPESEYLSHSSPTGRRQIMEVSRSLCFLADQLLPRPGNLNMRPKTLSSSGTLSAAVTAK